MSYLKEISIYGWSDIELKDILECYTEEHAAESGHCVNNITLCEDEKHGQCCLKKYCVNYEPDRWPDGSQYNEDEIMTEEDIQDAKTALKKCREIKVTARYNEK